MAFTSKAFPVSLFLCLAIVAAYVPMGHCRLCVAMDPFAEFKGWSRERIDKEIIAGLNFPPAPPTLSATPMTLPDDLPSLPPPMPMLSSGGMPSPPRLFRSGMRSRGGKGGKIVPFKEFPKSFSRASALLSAYGRADPDKLKVTATDVEGRGDEQFLMATLEGELPFPVIVQRKGMKDAYATELTKSIDSLKIILDLRRILEKDAPANELRPLLLDWFSGLREPIKNTYSFLYLKTSKNKSKAPMWQKGSMHLLADLLKTHGEELQATGSLFPRTNHEFEVILEETYTEPTDSLGEMLRSALLQESLINLGGIAAIVSGSFNEDASTSMELERSNVKKSDFLHFFDRFTVRQFSMKAKSHINTKFTPEKRLPFPSKLKTGGFIGEMEPEKDVLERNLEATAQYNPETEALLPTRVYHSWHAQGSDLETGKCGEFLRMLNEAQAQKGLKKFDYSNKHVFSLWVWRNQVLVECGPKVRYQLKQKAPFHDTSLRMGFSQYRVAISMSDPPRPVKFSEISHTPLIGESNHTGPRFALRNTRIYTEPFVNFDVFGSCGIKEDEEERADGDGSSSSLATLDDSSDSSPLR